MLVLLSFGVGFVFSGPSRLAAYICWTIVIGYFTIWTIGDSRYQKRKTAWETRVWTPEDFVPRLKELLPTGDLGVTVEFAKLLVWTRGMGPYTTEDLYETLKNPRSVPYSPGPGMINLFSTGSLRWSPKGLVWSDEIREKFFGLIPMPDDFSPDSSTV
ncbi:hypothetical protein IPJ70_03405 [Candidatus Campbellbacteria bacterium]|nr:MAG: hypothetical protein IPJ70_03405 [Candidatus Campbellbacteria bacterium]